MAEQIQVQYSTSAVTLYTVIRNTAGQVWNGTSFGTYSTASLSTYAINLTEQGTASRYYAVAFPATITTAGRYAFSIFQKLGGSYAETDTVISGGSLDWDGTAIAGSATTTLKVGSLVTASLGTFALAKTTNITGFNDIAATAIVSSGAITTSGGAVTNVTNVTNVNGLAANSITSSALATSAVSEIVSGVWDEPTASHTTAGTFGLAAGTAATAANVWAYGTRTLSSGVTLDFTQAYPGSPSAGSVGQCFNFIGTRLDTTVSSRGTGDATSTDVGNVQTDVTTLLSRLTSTRAGYLDNLSSAPPSSSTIATAVWDKDISGVSTANYAGTVLNAKSTTTALASAQTDITTLLGRLTSTRAGYLDNLATASPSAATIATAVWDKDISAYSTANLAGTNIKNIATPTSVWSHATRVLTAGTNIVLAKGTGVTGFNDIAATAIVSNGAITTSGGKVSGVALVDLTTDVTTKTGYALTSGERDSIATALLDLTDGVESGITTREALRAIGSAVLGQVSGGGTGSETFKAIGNSGTTRAVVSTTTQGNRTAVTLTL
jgi:hypothetical protein